MVKFRKRLITPTMLLALAFLFFAGCKEEPKRTVETTTVSFTKEGTLSLLKAETDSVLVQLDIEIAEGEYETQTGLMYRESMEKGQGMINKKPCPFRPHIEYQ